MRYSVMGLLLFTCSQQTSSDCLTLAANAQDQIESRYAFFQSGCSSDVDCVLVPAQLTCVKDCPVAVLSAESEGAMQDLAGHDSDICMGLACNIDLGCSPTFAACQNGICVTLPGDAGVPDAGSPDAGSSDGGP